jgi:hypothetical protein
MHMRLLYLSAAPVKTQCPTTPLQNCAFRRPRLGPVFSSRNINKLLTMQIGEYAAIWVGFADLCYGLLPTSKYKLLNMSSYCSKSFNYATHYNHGTQVKLQDSGKFTSPLQQLVSAPEGHSGVHAEELPHPHLLGVLGVALLLHQDRND